MEAKDTVMSDVDLDAITVTKEEVEDCIKVNELDKRGDSRNTQLSTAISIVLNQKVAKAQAEISFKAGAMKVVAKISPQIEAFIQTPKMPDEMSLCLSVWWQSFVKGLEVT